MAVLVVMAVGFRLYLETAAGKRWMDSLDAN